MDDLKLVGERPPRLLGKLRHDKYSLRHIGCFGRVYLASKALAF
jgi:hypothetical protein